MRGAEQFVTARANLRLRRAEFDDSGILAPRYAGGGNFRDDYPFRATTNGLKRRKAPAAMAAPFVPLLENRIPTMSLDVAYAQELAAHDTEIEDINAEAFGPGRFARAAYKIREGGPHRRDLSFVALVEGQVVASVRMTPIAAGKGRALLLGPLAVRPACKNLGIGKKLVAIALEAARKDGWTLVILVGDAPYYAPLGFSKVVPAGQLTMPRPVDPRRLLAAELEAGALDGFAGAVEHADMAAGAAEDLRAAAE